MREYSQNTVVVEVRGNRVSVVWKPMGINLVVRKRSDRPKKVREAYYTALDTVPKGAV